MSSHALEAARVAAAAGPSRRAAALSARAAVVTSLSDERFVSVARPSKSAKFILEFFVIRGLTATDDDDSVANCRG